MISGRSVGFVPRRHITKPTNIADTMTSAIPTGTASRGYKADRSGTAGSTFLRRLAGFRSRLLLVDFFLIAECPLDTIKQLRWGQFTVITVRQLHQQIDIG